MGLGFPGGPRVEKLARDGDETAYKFPRPFKGRDHADFSFAGLKTSVARAFDASDKSQISQANIAASFQRAVCDTLADRCGRAIDMFKTRHAARLSDGTQPHFVVAGGVAANSLIRARLTTLAAQNEMQFLAPPLRYCTDNAAMIALAGLTQLNSAETPRNDLALNARPRWPLDAEAAAKNPASGFGKKGPKS